MGSDAEPDATPEPTASPDVDGSDEGESDGDTEGTEENNSWLASVSDWFNRLLEGLELVKTTITDNIENLWLNLSISISNLGNKVATIPGVINQWFTSLFQTLNMQFSQIGEWITGIPKAIVDAFSELLQLLFVPQEDHFGELKEKIEAKFPIIEQAGELISILLGFSYGSDPVFTITYQGIEYPIIDLSDFNQYKLIVDAIIIAVAYGAFILRLYRKIPGIIGGFY